MRAPALAALLVLNTAAAPRTFAVPWAGRALLLYLAGGAAATFRQR